jgi:hypothetical protein
MARWFEAAVHYSRCHPDCKRRLDTRRRNSEQIAPAPEKPCLPQPGPAPVFVAIEAASLTGSVRLELTAQADFDYSGRLSIGLARMLRAEPIRTQ